MKNYNFTVVIDKDEDGNYLAICPSLQGCYTEGDTEDEAMESIKDAIRLHIEERLQNDEPIYEEVNSKKISVAV
ncbi:MAG: type II toxin-antitoxin system HicB family antitoxin [Ignavibacteriaceae bacterium]